VTFAGIMGFIYSDLMVPPLVMINARYYGWRVSLYVVAVMFASIVITALSMHYLFAALGITPESSNRVQEVVRFSLDYTFYLNLVFALFAAGLVWLHRRHTKEAHKKMDHQMETGGALKRNFARLSVAVLLVGVVAYFATS